MKHLMTSDKFFRAWCKRPGCGASLEGGIVEEMGKKELDEMFSNECPQPNGMKGQATTKTGIAYLLKYARKEIKAWEKLINYWKNR